MLTIIAENKTQYEIKYIRKKITTKTTAKTTTKIKRQNVLIKDWISIVYLGQKAEKEISRLVLMSDHGENCERIAVFGTVIIIQ